LAAKDPSTGRIRFIGKPDDKLLILSGPAKRGTCEEASGVCGASQPRRSMSRLARQRKKKKGPESSNAARRVSQLRAKRQSLEQVGSLLLRLFLT
jgi:hypothetical protein